MKYQATIAYGIIGLGRFGSALALSLTEAGKDVLVLDKEEKKIKDIQEFVGQALIAEGVDKTTLLEAGIHNCDTVIICIGEIIQTSIIAALNVIELGIPHVIAKAVNAEHGRVLEKLGAEVIYPERDQAIRLSQILSNSRAIDYIELSEEFSISDFHLTTSFDGKRVVDADFRGTYGLNIIAIITCGKTVVDIDPGMLLHEGDHIVMVGKKANIKEFASILNAE